MPELREAERQIVRLVNEFRQEQALSRLGENRQLARAAQEFAAFMARTGKYGHHADGRTPAQRAAGQGYEYCAVAENIAYQSSSRGFQTAALARGFIEGWKQSPGHRENMLRPHLAETGVAIARGDGGRYFAVQMLGRPAALRVRFALVNRSGSPVSYRMQGRGYELPPRVTRTHEQCAPAEISLAGKTFRARDGDRLVLEKRCPSGPAPAPRQRCVAVESAR